MFVATSASDALEIHFPLHPETNSSQHVSEMLERVLGAVSEVIDSHRRVSDGDVLQALAMASAIRMNLVTAHLETTERAMDGLLSSALEAVPHARTVGTG